jgi:hypothetical protein
MGRQKSAEGILRSIDRIEGPNVMTPVLRGWVNYFRLAEVKAIFEELDAWMRRKLRCVLWRQWKRTYAPAKNLMK